MFMFISCDWGTSSFRLRLVDQANYSVLAEVKNNLGISETYQKWKQQERNEGERIMFHQSIIADQLLNLQAMVKISLKKLPVIISGMASSDIGMVELPYKILPFTIDGSDLEYKVIAATESFSHKIILISGAKTSQDVMRGEESQLIGCDIRSDEERIFILPGTHSKHVIVKGGQVIDFKTYMTGEFFRLLSQHSILSKSVDENNQDWNNGNLKAFEDGVIRSMQDNLLHNAFMVRTNHLFGHFTKEANYYFLSGLLIGAELKELSKGKTPLTIVGNEEMRKYYSIALQRLGNTNFESIDVDRALVKGHCKMIQLL